MCSTAASCARGERGPPDADRVRPDPRAGPASRPARHPPPAAAGGVGSRVRPGDALPPRPRSTHPRQARARPVAPAVPDHRTRRRLPAAGRRRLNTPSAWLAHRGARCHHRVLRILSNRVLRILSIRGAQMVCSSSLSRPVPARSGLPLGCVLSLAVIAAIIAPAAAGAAGAPAAASNSVRLKTGTLTLSFTPTVYAALTKSTGSAACRGEVSVLPGCARRVDVAGGVHVPALGREGERHEHNRDGADQGRAQLRVHLDGPAARNRHPAV